MKFSSVNKNCRSFREFHDIKTETREFTCKCKLCDHSTVVYHQKAFFSIFICLSINERPILISPLNLKLVPIGQNAISRIYGSGGRKTSPPPTNKEYFLMWIYIFHAISSIFASGGRKATTPTPNKDQEGRCNRLNIPHPPNVH